MPLIAAGMSAAIKSKIDAKFPINTVGTTAAQASQWRQDFADVVAEAVVEYLVANNLVQVVTPMGPGTGTFT